ncbi:MAG: DedA family protein [Streptosporangiaceae bacterium]
MESFLVHAGYGALILFCFLEAACIPIPSEIPFGFAGVLAYQGHLNLALVIILGTLAELAGSLVSYGAGRKGGRPLVGRYGHYVLITRSDIDRAERFVDGRGAWAIPVGRALPFVRTFMSVICGIIEVPLARFALLSLLGTAIYASAVASVGYAVASAWTRIEHDISIASYIIVAVVVIALAAFFVHRIREVRKEARENHQDPVRDPVA